MSKQQTWLVARDTVLAFLVPLVIVAFLLWGAYHADFGISRTTFLRIVWSIVLAGFVLFCVLYGALVWSERSIYYTGREPSALHRPLITSTLALAIYFGIQSIAAVDFFLHPDHAWPLVLDPTVRIFGALLVLVVVLSKAWLTWEILPTSRWTLRWKFPRSRAAGGS